MDFERGIVPTRTLDIGRNRLIKAGDIFEVKFKNDIRIKVIAWDNETRFKEVIIAYILDYWVRQVNFTMIGGTLIAQAILYENQENPEWELLGTTIL